MPDNYKDIEELFKDAASNASGPPPPPPDWGSMSSLLQESAVLQTGAGAAKVGFLKALGTKAMMAKVLIGSVVVGGVVTGGYLVLKDSGKGQDGLGNATAEAQAETTRKESGRSATYAEGLALNPAQKRNLQGASSQTSAATRNLETNTDNQLLNTAKTDLSTDLSTFSESPENNKDPRSSIAPYSALQTSSDQSTHSSSSVTNELERIDDPNKKELLAANGEIAASAGLASKETSTGSDNITGQILASDASEESHNASVTQNQNTHSKESEGISAHIVGITETEENALSTEKESTSNTTQLGEVAEHEENTVAASPEDTSSSELASNNSMDAKNTLATETQEAPSLSPEKDALENTDNLAVQPTSNTDEQGDGLLEEALLEKQENEINNNELAAGSGSTESETIIAEENTAPVDANSTTENQGDENNTALNATEDDITKDAANSLDSLHQSSLAQEEEKAIDSKQLSEAEKKQMVDSLTKVIDSLAPEVHITMGHAEPRWLLSPYVSIDKSNYGIDAITLNNLAASTRNLQLGSASGTYSVGLRGAYNIAPYLWLESGFLYSKKSAITGTMELYDENDNINALANYQLSGEFYEIPIALSVRGNNDYFGWYFKAGVHLAYNRASAQSFFEYYDYDLEKVFTITPSTQTLNPAITASAGFEYNLNQKLRFYAEPTFRLATRPVLNTNEFNNVPLNPKWSTVGLGFGINYYFGKR